MQKKRKHQISESNLHDFGVTTDAAQEWQHFLVSRTEKLWKYLVELNGNQVRKNGENPAYVPLTPERSLDDTKQNLSPPKNKQHR